jgi:hypothetical protein
MRRAMTVLISILMSVTPTFIAAQDQESESNYVVWVGLANGSESEAIMAKELRDLLRAHDTRPWILTKKILIDAQQIPHSHPVLTIHTRHIGDELALLSTFIHEQLHWLEEKPWLEAFQAAMKNFERLFPVVPSSTDGGARDRRSTYPHLLVCDMELQALTTLIGETAAWETLAQITHYAWIYDKVLNDPRVREVTLAHGFGVSEGVPDRWLLSKHRYS